MRGSAAEIGLPERPLIGARGMHAVVTRALGGWQGVPAAEDARCGPGRSERTVDIGRRVGGLEAVDLVAVGVLEFPAHYRLEQPAHQRGAGAAAPGHGEGVKVFNTIGSGHLQSLPRPAGAGNRTALTIAGDDAGAERTVTAFLDAIGYDATAALALRPVLAG